MEPLRIRTYRAADEESWLRCRVLSFLHSAYFDDVRREKERYANPAIELVAEADGEIVGLIDVECELEPGTVCEDRPGLGGMIWHLAVHPDHQRRGVATALLAEAERLAADRSVVRFEAWTRDDAHVQAWYESHGFEQIYARRRPPRPLPGGRGHPPRQALRPLRRRRPRRDAAAVRPRPRLRVVRAAVRAVLTGLVSSSA